MVDPGAERPDDGIREQTARLLADRGLIGRAFDVDVIVADLRSRLEADSSLDDLIGPGEPG